jgi:hypothetical protein
MSYSKQGVNYGIGQLSDTQVEADLTFLRQHTQYIRISYPAYNSQFAIDYWKGIILKAKAKDFHVMWGLYCPNNQGANWFAFLQKFVELSSWAAQHDVVFGLNEDMFHNDDFVVPDEIAIKSIHEAAKLAKFRNPNVKLHISLSGSGELDKFIAVSGPTAAGRGAFDFVCLNQYDTLANHKANIDKLTNAYGAATCVTEFNTGRGFDPAYGNEAIWKQSVKDRADYMEASQVAAFYFYTYDRNLEETSPGSGILKWNLRIGPTTHHETWDLFKKV